MDVNIRRLLVRAIDGEEHPKQAPTAREKARRLAVLPEKNAHVWAAATMELGALVCTSKIQLASCVRSSVNANA